jgi:hypothetical protein
VATVTKPISADDLVKVMFDALARSQAHEGVPAEAQRTVLWLCPECGIVARETQEAGHPMTSEMRRDSVACSECAASKPVPSPPSSTGV